MFCCNCITGLLITAIPCSSNASVRLSGILQVVTRSSSAEAETETKTQVFYDPIGLPWKNLRLKRKIILLKMIGFRKVNSPSITSHFHGLLSLTESLQIQVEWKQHLCFVHAHHENTSSIKINFKFLTVLLFHYSYK